MVGRVKVTDKMSSFIFLYIYVTLNLCLFFFCFLLKHSLKNQTPSSVSTRRPVSIRKITLPSCFTSPSPKPHSEPQRERGSLVESKRKCRVFCLQRRWSCTKWVLPADLLLWETTGCFVWEVKVVWSAGVRQPCRQLERLSHSDFWQIALQQPTWHQADSIKHVFFLSQSYLKWSGKKPVIFQPGINKVYLSNWSLTKLQTSANEKERVGDRKHPNRQWAVAKYGNNVRNSGDISGAVGRVPVSSDKLQSLMCSLVFGCCVSGDGDKRPRERRLWLQCVWRFPGERSLCEHDPTWWTGRPSWAQTLRQDTAGDDGTLWNYKHHEEDEQQICRE